MIAQLLQKCFSWDCSLKPDLKFSMFEYKTIKVVFDTYSLILINWLSSSQYLTDKWSSSPELREALSEEELCRLHEGQHINHQR